MHDEHTIRAHSGDSRVLEPENLWDEILPGHLAARMPHSEKLIEDEEELFPHVSAPPTTET